MYDTNIRGAVSVEDLKTIEYLASLVPKNGIVVEVGSFLGCTGYALAKSVHSSVTVYCIDKWDNKNMAGKGLCSFDVFKENTKDCPNIISIQADSPFDEIIKNWNKFIDLYFDDANHSLPTIRHNMDHWEQFVKPTGILCGHDYDPFWYENESDVKILVDELYEVDGLWIVSKDNKKLNPPNISKFRYEKQYV